MIGPALAARAKERGSWHLAQRRPTGVTVAEDRCACFRGASAQHHSHAGATEAYCSIKKTPPRTVREETWTDPALPTTSRRSGLAWRSYAVSASTERPAKPKYSRTLRRDPAEAHTGTGRM